MSMTTLTLLQLLSVFCAYTFVTIVLPALVFRPLLRGRRIPEQFLLCLLIGNFFVMNLVFVLQLLHISGTVTLVFSTLIVAVVAGVKINKIDVRKLFLMFVESLKRFHDKRIGRKTLLYHVRCHIADGLRIFGKGCYRLVVKKAGQWLWVALILVAICMIYGPQLLTRYGYSASDIPVHLYWINAMKENDIFVAGVYPFGYHCVVYYINEVFAIDIYVIMRVMAFVQNVYINLVLLAFLKLCCRNKYIPYLASFLFVTAAFFNVDTFKRYYAPLPQEFGMLFILPAIYFGFKFFEERKKELEAGETKKKESMLCLVGFAISFSMTLAVHFYGTMIAGLFCVAMAMGYFLLFVKKRYFWNIIVTCIISVMIAAAPMVIAFATGTPLQGSLGWGLNIISGNSEEETESETETETVAGTMIPSVVVPSGDGEAESETIREAVEETVEQDNTLQIQGITEEKQEEEQKPELSLGQVAGKMKDALEAYVFEEGYKNSSWGVYIAVLLVIVTGCINQIFGRYCYGSMLISCGVYIMIMNVLQAAGVLGLPRLMDGVRCGIYLAYSLPVLIAFCADGVLNLIFWKEKLVLIKNAVSLVVAVTVCIWMNWEGEIREAQMPTTLQTNEAVTCLTNIIREEKDFKWTICSANDETQMGKEHGYHYEIIDFLWEMENVGERGYITLPTETVYFFIEKRPIDYTEVYQNSGQMVSQNGAMNELPRSQGIKMYKGEKRWIVMSRMYYWALEFQRMYPNELSVYFENENFICYKLEQNPYRLYNFAIDYGYNIR